ncbi:sulfotransferase [Sinisalibacter aestuarii]|uniref:Sulfotransferase family protein n=1 Tax=Sinisalibacter aestuarii TaxID=2949426 RepID=A0ABQ5LU85_9RHOB|nr:sulfotransferase [Sinisalibacter aestuarii]GKY88546.1 hypothetical protein STA1M1_24150 [Sinisalibacter aestuarii]
MAGRKQIVLHIGTHKTGTTSFQHSLRANYLRLRRQGVRPLANATQKRGLRRVLRPSFNNTVLADAFLRPGCATIARMKSHARFPKPEGQAANRAEYLRRIQKARAPMVFISAEALCFLRTPEEQALMRAFLDATGREAKIILTLRDEEAWRASWNNQLRKNPGVWTWMEKLPEQDRSDGAWYFDRAALQAFWSALGEVVTVDYDAAKRDEGNTLPAMYRAMGLDPARFRLDYEKNQRVPLADDDDD